MQIACAPEKGRANQALIAFIAERLGVPKSAVRIERGEASRKKTVRVASAHADPERLLGEKS